MGGRYIFFFNNTDYLQYDSSRKKCILAFVEDTSSQTTFWLIGDPFLRAYYIIHDMDNLKVGLAGKRVDLGADAALGGVSLTNDRSGGSGSSSSDPFTSYIMYIIIAVGGAVAFMILGCILKKCCPKKGQ